LPNLPLSDREKRILNYLGTVDRSGFNELFLGLEGHANRKNLKISLDRLIKMRLVHVTKTRRGYKDLYILQENVDKFAEHCLLLFAEWEVVQQQLRQLDKIIKDDELGSETKVAFLTLLVCRAALIIGRVAFIDDEKIPVEMKDGILDYSLKEFHNFLEETSRLAKRHPSVVEGFESVSLKVLSDKIGKNVQSAFRRIFATARAEDKLSKPNWQKKR